MKVRQGFVSNSSSSSFVIRDNEYYADVFELAADMIRLRRWDEDKALLTKIKNSKLSRNMPISFGTVNYDTYIVKHDGYYHVQTCNNTDWDGGGYWEKLPDDKIEHREGTGLQGILSRDKSMFWNQDIEEIDISHRFNFWFPEHEIAGKDLIGHSLRYSTNCECGGWDLVGLPYPNGIVCLKCKKEIQPLTGGRSMRSCCFYKDMHMLSRNEKSEINYCPTCGTIRLIAYGPTRIISEWVV